MRSCSLFSVKIFCLSTAALLISGTAAAKDAVSGEAAATQESASTPDDAPADEGLADIVVTARRTSENVQEIPSTVNVVTGERLENAGVRNTSEIRNLVSNLYWDDNGGSTENRITLRGIASNASRQGFETGIGVYIDDVYISDTTGFNTALVDIDRIEVLKGPQGTLFGRNTLAGAIAIHTRRPSTREFFSEFDFRIGNYDAYQGRGVVNMPVSDKVALKVSGIYRDRDGYQTNVVTGRRDLNDERFYGGRAQLLFTPTENLDILATADYFRNKDHQNVFTCQGGPGCGFHPDFDSIFDDRAGDNGSFTDRELWSGALNVVWRHPSGAELTSITAYQHRKYITLQDQDYTGVDLNFSGYLEPDAWQFSQELRIASPRESALRGVAGLYYAYEDRPISIPQLVNGDVATSVLPPAIVNMLPGKRVPDLILPVNAHIKNKSFAAFGQATYDITPRLTAELGIRYTYDDKDFFYQTEANAEALVLPAPIRAALTILPFGPINAQASWGKATGLASLSWRPTDDLNFYARFSQGYKSGAFQSVIPIANNAGVVLTRPDIPVRPETLDAYEIGAKAQFFNDRLRVNVAAFQMDYTDIQVQIDDPVTRLRFAINGGKARSRGAELELSVAPFAGLTLDGGIGYQNARFTENAVVGGVNVTNFAGKRVALAPRTTANLTGTYRVPLFGDWEGMVSGTANYRSLIYLDADNLIKSPGVTTLNGRIGLAQKDGFGIFIFGENLTDERRITTSRGGRLGLSVRNYMISPPRTYGIELRAKF